MGEPIDRPPQMMQGLIVEPYHFHSMPREWVEQRLTLDMPHGFGFEARPRVNLEQMRRYALFWDRLDWPRGHAIDFRIKSRDLDILSAEDVYTRSELATQFVIGDRESAEMIGAAVQLSAFEEFNRRPGERWAIARPYAFDGLPRRKVISARTLQVSLVDTVFSPSVEVPMEEVVRFRRSRRDHLVEFRSAMQELYQGVAAAPDTEEALDAAARRVRESVSTLRRLMREQRWPGRHFTWKADVDAGRLGGAIATCAVTGFNVTHELTGATIGAIAGYVAARLSIHFRPRVIPPEMLAYAYVLEAEDQLAAGGQQ